MRKEKRKEGKDPEGGSKKCKKKANDNPLACMFAKQQAVSALLVSYSLPQDTFDTFLPFSSLSSSLLLLYCMYFPEGGSKVLTFRNRDVENQSTTLPLLFFLKKNEQRKQKFLQFIFFQKK